MRDHKTRLQQHRSNSHLLLLGLALSGCLQRVEQLDPDLTFYRYSRIQRRLFLDFPSRLAPSHPDLFLQAVGLFWPALPSFGLSDRTPQNMIGQWLLLLHPHQHPVPSPSLVRLAEAICLCPGRQTSQTNQPASQPSEWRVHHGLRYGVPD